MRSAALGLWVGVAASCAPARGVVFVDRLEEGRPVLLRCDGEICAEEGGAPGALREGDVLVEGRPSRAARRAAEARIGALRRRLGAAPLEVDLSLERTP